MATNDHEKEKSIGFQVHTFSEKLMDTQVFFQTILFDHGFFLWIGTSPAALGDLSLAMKTKYSQEPSTSTLFGTSDSPTTALAQRLAKKTSKQVFVGGNMNYNQLMLPLIEKRIGEEMKSHPGIYMQ
ncbi:proteasome assembly chaperone 4-like [Mytilus edulis]|uniref:proteasome assembly chaperone 4-like n=1 Tax=Mytilus edulis TaxID=6550 RepID=UPI0039F0FF6C